MGNGTGLAVGWLGRRRPFLVQQAFVKDWKARGNDTIFKALKCDGKVRGRGDFSWKG